VTGTLVGMFLGSADPTRLPRDFTGAKGTDESLYARVFHALLAAGVALPPGAYEALFVGLGHDDAVMELLAERVAAGLATLAA
jgi:glutamate-1-semialdehyde 2,1-aminomutase